MDSDGKSVAVREDIPAGKKIVKLKLEKIAQFQL